MGAMISDRLEILPASNASERGRLRQALPAEGAT